MATIAVRANRAILGLQPGQVGEVDDSDYAQSAIEAGYLERVTDDELNSGAAQAGQPDTSGDESF